MADSSDSEPEFEEVEPVVLPGAHSSAAVEAEDSDDEPVIEYLTDDEVTLVDEEEDPPVIEDLDTEFAAVPRELADLSIFEAKEALEKAMFTARETKSRGNDAFRSGALENALAWYAEARRDLEAYAGLAARLGDYDRRMTPATTKQASATDELRDLRVDLLICIYPKSTRRLTPASRNFFGINFGSLQVIALWRKVIPGGPERQAWSQ